MSTRLLNLSRFLLLVVILAVTQSGCGQKGALYLPDDNSRQEEEDRR